MRFISSKPSSGGTKIGRSAESGQFVPVKVATTKPNTHVVETIKPKGK